MLGVIRHVVLIKCQRREVGDALRVVAHGLDGLAYLVASLGIVLVQLELELAFL